MSDFWGHEGYLIALLGFVLQTVCIQSVNVDFIIPREA